MSLRWVLCVSLCVTSLSCAPIGHDRTKVRVGLDLLGFELITAVSVERETLTAEALRAGARMGDASRSAGVMGEPVSHSDGTAGPDRVYARRVAGPVPVCFPCPYCGRMIRLTPIGRESVRQGLIVDRCCACEGIAR